MKQSIFHRKQLVMAISMALIGGAMTGCSSDDAAAPLSVQAPSSVYTLVTAGGTGGNISGVGGRGGGIELYNDGGTGGIEVSKSGVANTGFSTPVSVPAANLGDNPLAITVNTTIKTVDFGVTIVDAGVTTAGQLYLGTDGILRTATDIAANYATDTVLPVGTAYTRLNNVGVYERGTGAITEMEDDIRFTGLSVAANATLTLVQNASAYCCVDYIGYAYGVAISFKNDISNSGTITRDASNSDTDLNLIANYYVGNGSVLNAGVEDAVSGGRIGIYVASGISNSGLLNTSGFNETDEMGGNGGQIDLRAGGYVINSGVLNASGGDGVGGGSSGGVYFYAAYAENTAAIDASGGSNIDGSGDGGYGGEVSLGSDYVTNNRGDINISGGAGDTGGRGGYMWLSNDDAGRVINVGDITALGGNATVGSAGDGGSFYVYAYGGDFVNNADITTVGGNTAVANLSGSGGDGGELVVYSYPGINNIRPGNIEISGNINAGGGDALGTDGTGGGGNGANLYVRVNNYDNNITNTRIALLGYASIDASGGDGGDGGEGAGATYYSNDVTFETYNGWNDANQEYTTGSVTNNVPIDVTGGNSTAIGTADGAGGDGGEVNMRTSTSSEIVNSVATVNNSAAINVSGGNGINGADIDLDSAGSGGSVYMQSYHGTSNSGVLTASGGNGAYYGGYGGQINMRAERNITNSANVIVNGGEGIYAGGGGNVYMSGEGSTTNSGAVSANGGTSAQQSGGDGGYVSLYGATATNTAALSVNGGNAADPYDDGFSSGGDGGEIYVRGEGVSATTNSGTPSYVAGNGEANGTEGSATIGFTCAGNCTP